jgi:hypothetical protein
MEIIIEKQFTRIERLALILKQIEEAELHGYGSINITIHNHQITDSSLNKMLRFGNTGTLWYDSH